MRYKILVYAFVPVMAFGLLGVSAVYAHGFFGGFGRGFSGVSSEQIATQTQTMFQNMADTLGISVDEVKAGWAQGKNIAQIAQDQGISQEQLQQKMQEARQQQLKTQMQSLVDKGIITQSQADQRLKWMETKTQKATGKVLKGIKGMHGWGF